MALGIEERERDRGGWGVLFIVSVLAFVIYLLFIVLSLLLLWCWWSFLVSAGKDAALEGEDGCRKKMLVSLVKIEPRTY